jgi:hypothetical protein
VFGADGYASLCDFHEERDELYSAVEGPIDWVMQGMVTRKGAALNKVWFIIPTFNRHSVFRGVTLTIVIEEISGRYELHSFPI